MPPDSFKENTPKGRAHTAAGETLDEIAPVPEGPDNKGATVLAAAMSEIATAGAALDAAQASFADIDKDIEGVDGEIEGVDGEIELFHDLIDEGDTELIGRLARTKKRLAELRAQREAVLGDGGEGPLGFGRSSARTGYHLRSGTRSTATSGSR